MTSSPQEMFVSFLLWYRRGRGGCRRCCGCSSRFPRCAYAAEQRIAPWANGTSRPKRERWQWERRKRKEKRKEKEKGKRERVEKEKGEAKRERDIGGERENRIRYFASFFLYFFFFFFRTPLSVLVPFSCFFLPPWIFQRSGERTLRQSEPKQPP